jgi:hypothetical protein
MQLTQTALGIDQRAFQRGDDVVFRHRLQHVHAAAREQRGVEFERRVFGSGTDEDDHAFFDMR